MSAKSRLLTKSDTVINFTNRIDIKASQILFEISVKDDRTFRYRITLRSWAALASKISSKHNMTLQFERGGEPTQRVKVGNAERIIRGGGVITGMIDGGFDPAALGMKVIISDPSNMHLIVASGTKGKPDIADADIGDDENHQPERISPMRQASGKGESLINVYVSDEVSGGWNLILKNVECPHLVVSPIIGKQPMTEDPYTQRLVFPEVVRRILSELALHPETYATEQWISLWQKFGAGLSGIGDWAYFTDGDSDPDPDFVHARVDEAVRRYSEQYLSLVDAPADRNMPANEE